MMCFPVKMRTIYEQEKAFWKREREREREKKKERKRERERDFLLMTFIS